MADGYVPGGLVLKRMLGEDVIIGDINGEHVVISVVEIRGGGLRSGFTKLAIKAPAHIPVDRREIAELKSQSKTA